VMNTTNFEIEYVVCISCLFIFEHHMNGSEYQCLTLRFLLSIILKRGRFDALTYKSKVTLSVLPNMLRVDFDRSGIQGDGKHLLLPNFPMSDGPNYLQPINAVNVQVTVSSIFSLVLFTTLIIC
jgi:hypothetical protein